MSIGERLAMLRQDRRISQEELGAVLGCSRQTVYKWEHEKSVPTGENLRAIAEYFGISIDELVCGGEPARKPEVLAKPVRERYSRHKWKQCVALGVLCGFGCLSLSFGAGYRAGLESVRQDGTAIEHKPQDVPQSVQQTIPVNPQQNTPSSLSQTGANVLMPLAEAPQSYPVPAENRTSMAASDGSDGYYGIATALRYYDAETKTHTVLCTKPECKHTDSTCPAWVGILDGGCIEYHGAIYTLVCEDERQNLRFVKKDPADGSITELDSWERTEGTSYDVRLTICSYGKALLSENKKEYHYESYEDEYGHEGAEQVIDADTYTWWLYDLATGEKEAIDLEMVKGEEWLSKILALTDEVVVYTVPEEKILSEEEYAAQYGDDADYSGYWYRMWLQRKLQLYDIAAGTTTTLSDFEHGFRAGDNSVVYDKTLVYQEDDTIWLYDLEAREQKVLLDMENVIQYWVLDRKVFLVASDKSYSQEEDPYMDPNLAVKNYYADLVDGEPVQIGADTSNAEFYPVWEGDSFFVGRWQAMNYVIDKEDFYTRNFENAQLGGY